MGIVILYFNRTNVDNIIIMQDHSVSKIKQKWRLETYVKRNIWYESLFTILANEFIQYKDDTLTTVLH